MSRDIIADTLNEIMNAKKAGKAYIEVSRHSKLLLNVLEMMKNLGYIEYELENNRLKIIMKDLGECKAIKPRYNVRRETLERFVRRYLPARNFGYVIVSTSKGLMTHEEANENKIGGNLIAYFY